jgi:hypothetical protein
MLPRFLLLSLILTSFFSTITLPVHAQTLPETPEVQQMEKPQSELQFVTLFWENDLLQIRFSDGLVGTVPEPLELTFTVTLEDGDRVVTLVGLTSETDTTVTYNAEVTQLP